MLKVALFNLFATLVVAVATQGERGAPVSFDPVSTNDSCPATGEATAAARSEITQNVRELLRRTVVPSLGCRSGECEANPASSCAAIYGRNPLLESGEYWIRRCDGVAVEMYCEMDASRFNQTGGWMRVVYLDGANENRTCPRGLDVFEEGGVRGCASSRPNTCISTSYASNYISYSQVCGRVVGYQDGSPDAFAPFFANQDRTIDDNYVDGVSITHGCSPRKHIWTFAAAVDEAGAPNMYRCPCTNNGAVFSGIVPPFIGQDYFCDSASRGNFQFTFYPNDPLWDGAGCGPTSTCCSFNNPPWFCKRLPQPTLDNIEVRFCGDQSLGDENIAIELVEIYVM